MSVAPRRYDFGRWHAVAGAATRRDVLTGGGALAAAHIARLPEARAEDRDGISFGLTPVFLSNDLVLLDRLRTYLESACKTPVRLVTRRTYQEITALLIAGQLDAAWICGYPYIKYRDQLSLVAVPLWNGRALYQSYLIVQAGRAANGIGDLSADIHAFSDPDSNSGYLVTRALLVDLDTTPDRFFERAFFTYSHRNVIRAVASGLAGSGSVDGYVWEVMRKVEPDLVSRTRVVQRSDWLGFPPVACAKSAADKPKTARVRSALLDMPADPAGREVLGMLQLDGFAERPPDHFASIAELFSKVRPLG